MSGNATPADKQTGAVAAHRPRGKDVAAEKNGLEFEKRSGGRGKKRRQNGAKSRAWSERRSGQSVTRPLRPHTHVRNFGP
ncbi:unnamed protein product, partial [Iphiclides podalirius]